MPPGIFNQIAEGTLFGVTLRPKHRKSRKIFPTLGVDAERWLLAVELKRELIGNKDRLKVYAKSDGKNSIKL